MEKKLSPVHLGEVLLEEFLQPGDQSESSGYKIGFPARRINEIVLGKRRITAKTALRLARFFGTTAKFWLGLPTDYNLDVTADESGERIEREISAYNPAG